MPRMTPQQYQDLRARQSRAAEVTFTAPKPKPRRESELHRQIKQECNRRELVAFHGRMDKASGRTAGEPDFTILLPGGRVLFIEAKKVDGMLSEDQIRIHRLAALLDHQIYVVRCFQDFHALLNRVMEVFPV